MAYYAILAIKGLIDPAELYQFGAFHQAAYQQVNRSGSVRRLNARRDPALAGWSAILVCRPRVGDPEVNVLRIGSRRSQLEPARASHARRETAPSPQKPGQVPTTMGQRLVTEGGLEPPCP